MNIRLPRHIRYVLLLSLCTIFFSSLFTARSSGQAAGPDPKIPSGSSAVPTATLDLEIILAQDGVAPMNTVADQVNGRSICPVNPTAGCDFDEHNGIVRTHDSVIYTYDYNVNGGDAADIIIRAIAPFGMVWNYTPGFCLGDGPPTGDGVSTQSTITCHRGPQAAGTAESLPFTAAVLGDRPNGSTRTTIGILSDGPAGPQVFAGSPQVTISAAPRYNLRKDFAGHTGNGMAGYNITFIATVGLFDDYPTADALNPWYGSSALAGSITFRDDVSGISPNAQLVGCSVQNNYGASAGSISCTQPSGDGTEILATVTGADTTLNQHTVPPVNGVFGVGGYAITVHIPGTDVGMGGRDITNVLTTFDPNSITAQSNFGPAIELLDDNGTFNHIDPPGGGLPGHGIFRKRFVDFDTAGDLGFNSFVAPGQIFASEVTLGNDTAAPLTNVVLCDVMDISKYRVIETSPGSGVVHVIGAGTPSRVEFATGYVDPGWLPTSSAGNAAGLIDECTDASVPWSTTLPADLSTITKFRVVYDAGNIMTADDGVIVRVRVQARDTDLSNQPIPSGTALANFGIWRSDQENPGYISNTFYQNMYPDSPTGTTNFGGRVTLARATVRISKETENNNQTNSIETGSGNGIGFVLKPVVNQLAIPTGPVTVTVTDVLPLALTFIQGSGNTTPQPTQTTCGALPLPLPPSCTDPGQQALIWTFNNVTPGTPMTAITFRVTADLTVLTNQTLTNTAIVASPADPSPESARTASRTIFGAAPSTFLIYKKSSVPLIDVNGSFSYTVSYRNASFLTDFSGMDFIDVLPFAGDNTLPFGSGTHTRNPASAFNGSITLSSIAAAAGAAWYFSNAPASTINISPKHSSNLSPGAGPPWCLGTAAGPNVGCGFTLSQATAVRMQDTAVMLRNNTVRTFTLNFTTNGNVANNVYTNNSGGSVNEILLPVSSINVPVTVRDGKISGLVWYDTNGDGVRQPAETGRVGSSLVTLTGPVSGTQTTGPSGAYSFNGLPGGAYTVKFTKPINYRISPQDQGGSDTTDSDGDPVTLIAAVPDLGAAATTVDQGFYQLNLRGTVWNDGNPDGRQGGIGEGPITTPIFDLELLDDQDIVVRKTQTTGGDYVFVNLPAGDYKIRMTTNSIPVSPVFFANPNDDVDRDNNGMQETINSLISNTISLAPGTEPEINHTNGTSVNRTLDFGLFLQPTAAGVAVGGRVLTADGRGIGKALVTMTGTGGTVHRALTNPFGYYRFDNVAAGTTVLISVSSKSHTFEVGTRVISVSDELLDVNFTAIE